MKKRHVKASQQNPGGGIEEKPATIHISNVMFLDPKSGKRSRVGRKFVEGKGKEKGRWVRVSKSSGTELS